jgi:redox-sensitive bicupin YhaK (pirin superfamily)
MIALRRAQDRGHADHGWLDTRHSFSFADYYDAQEMGWGPLRVINEDVVAPGSGFGMHGHRDMEIVTYLLSGALEHRDSMGNGEVIRPGEVQRMSAGTGVMHSEFNPSPQEPVHLLQIWIQPDVKGVQPSYEQKAFPDAARRGRLLQVASGDGSQDSVTIHQDARVYASVVEPGDRLTHELLPGRLAYLHLVRGALQVNGMALAGGDGAKVVDEAALTILAEGPSELLLFDLPGDRGH